ncbi:Adenine nucleotide transporter 1 isoform 1 [Hibiscus syriacus]|uniref:Adenine nucleotide transporter 1 isoform 1 n=1 Tax=Hibiscus syriacus TaxID=106335 RepID=A0A6A2YFV8_HIBSY|nr:COP1-interactive protein 1-like [Hibiscus syriacus]XP_039031992.1 COP1-interactive protein 1-like [Hibiscus syriacus]KAE8675709.1 Adenine nucleotide transporter 1 isoform 1 [Hibiscus syriacus]
MTKHRFRESIKSFFGNHVDPEKDEQLKGSKIEIDNKVTKILKLVKDEENDSTKEPLVELIEDFHKHYQSLYEQYDHLTGELRRKVHGKREKDASSSSSSDSDSDHSSENRGSKNGQVESESWKMADSIKQELEAANLEIANLKRKLTTTSEEKDALNSGYLASLSKVREAEEIIKCLKLESERAENKITQVLVENEELRHKLDTAAKLEAEVNQRLEDLNRENDNLILEKESSSKRIEDGEKFTEDLRREVDQLKEENITLKQELESARGEVSNLQPKLESAENQVTELRYSLNATVEENKSLHSKLSEALNEVQQAQDKIQELMTGMSQSKDELVEKEREVSTLKELHETHVNQSSAQIKGLEGHVASLELELEMLQAASRDMAVQIENKANEAEHLGEQNIGLQSRISVLEMMSKKREEELLTLKKKLEDDQKLELESQINDQQRMLEEQGEAYKKLTEECQQVECKENLEVAERKMQEMSEEFESKSQMAADLKRMVEGLQRDLEAERDEKNDLVNQITDHQIILKEQEEAFNKLCEEYKQLEASFKDCKAIIEVTEMKMQEMAGEHDKSVQCKDQTVADLEQTIEDLRRDLEMKVDELSTFTENVRTIEVKLRLSNQKLRVTEQLLTEKEESFRKAEAKFLEEQRMLEERITTLSGIIAANKEVYHRMITDISENVNNTLTGFEAVIQKLEEGYRKYEHCLEETSKELKIAKHWGQETKREKKQLINEVTNLIEQLKDQKEQGSTLRERVEKLQIKANKEEGEKENLLKTVKQLENKVEFLERAMKEKDQGILGLGEEKREAIRQLCIWIDYHRSRCDDLKETARVQRAA